MRIRPLATFACSKRSMASSSAPVSRLPGAGTISGDKLGIIAVMVFVSSVSGETVWASPANTIRAVTPSSRISRRSVSLRFARISRLGLTSVASMLRDRSKMTTRASSRSCTGWGVCRQTGPASATVASSQAMRTSDSGLRLTCLFGLSRMCSSRWGAIAFSQLLCWLCR